MSGTIEKEDLPVAIGLAGVAGQMREMCGFARSWFVPALESFLMYGGEVEPRGGRLQRIADYVALCEHDGFCREALRSVYFAFDVVPGAESDFHKRAAGLIAVIDPDARIFSPEQMKGSDNQVDKRWLARAMGTAKEMLELPDSLLPPAAKLRMLEKLRAIPESYTGGAIVQMMDLWLTAIRDPGLIQLASFPIKQACADAYGWVMMGGSLPGSFEVLLTASKGVLAETVNEKGWGSFFRSIREREPFLTSKENQERLATLIGKLPPGDTELFQSLCGCVLAHHRGCFFPDRGADWQAVYKAVRVYAQSLPKLAGALELSEIEQLVKLNSSAGERWDGQERRKEIRKIVFLPLREVIRAVPEGVKDEVLARVAGKLEAAEQRNLQDAWKAGAFDVLAFMELMRVSDPEYLTGTIERGKVPRWVEGLTLLGPERKGWMSDEMERWRREVAREIGDLYPDKAKLARILVTAGRCAWAVELGVDPAIAKRREAADIRHKVRRWKGEMEEAIEQAINFDYGRDGEQARWEKIFVEMDNGIKDYESGSVGLVDWGWVQQKILVIMQNPRVSPWVKKRFSEGNFRELRRMSFGPGGGYSAEDLELILETLPPAVEVPIIESYFLEAAMMEEKHGQVLKAMDEGRVDTLAALVRLLELSKKALAVQMVLPDSDETAPLEEFVGKKLGEWANETRRKFGGGLEPKEGMDPFTRQLSERLQEREYRRWKRYVEA